MLFNCLLSYVVQKKYNIRWLDITFRKRYFGTSKYNFSKMLLMFINLMLKA